MVTHVRGVVKKTKKNKRGSLRDNKLGSKCVTHRRPLNTTEKHRGQNKRREEQGGRRIITKCRHSPPSAGLPIFTKVRWQEAEK